MTITKKIIVLLNHLFTSVLQQRRGLTDVIVEVALTVVKPFMDNDFFHLERLLCRRIALIQGVLSKNHREAAALLVGSKIKVHKAIRLTDSTPAETVRCHFPPIKKAVGSCQDPTCRDQTPATAKNVLLALAAPEDGRHPWVGFHCGNGSANNLHLPPLSAPAAGGGRGCDAENKLNVAQKVKA